MRIRWTQPAARDLTKICDYITEHDSAANARRVALSIYQRVSSLRQFPERGRPGRKKGTREFVLGGLPYLAIYRVEHEVAEILRVLRGAQDWPQ